MNFLYSFRKKSKFKSHENVCKDYDYCHMIMSIQENSIFKNNQNKKSLKILFIIYADTKSLLEKIHACDENPEKSFTEKIRKHKTCCYSLLTHYPCDSSRSEHDFYRSDDCIKKFCVDLRNHATKMINYERKKCCHWHLRRITHTRIKQSATSAKRGFMIS